MKRHLALAALGLVAVCTTGCDDAESTPAEPAADLVVEYSAWNGWDRDDVPEVLQGSLIGAVGEEVTVESAGGITIAVVEVDGNEITLRISQEMAPRSGSGINLSDTTDTFVVEPDAPAAFTTATMDAGWNFEVRYDEGVSSSTGPNSTCAPDTAGCGRSLE